MVPLTLTHAALDIAVETPVREGTWLSGFLYPAFRPMASAERDLPMVRFDPRAHVPAFPRHPSSLRVAFALDQGPVLMSGTPTDGGTFLVDAERGMVFTVLQSPLSVVVHAEAPGARARVALMRVVREFAHNAVIDGGGLVLHAAAVAAPQGALLLTGPKGAGKTTMLARLLGLDGIDYLSNDRVVVSPPLSDGPLTALPMPTIVGVREGTRAMLPRLADRLSTIPAFTADADSPPTIRAATGTWYLSPHQFASALARRLAWSADVAALVVLSGFGPSSSRQLDQRSALDAVRAAVLGQHSGHVTSEVFRVSPCIDDARASIDAGCRRLASSVPVFAITVPAEPDPAAFEAMVRSWR